MRGTWSVFTRDLLRLKSGKPIPTARINAALEALERSAPVTGAGSGIEIKQLPSGTSFRADPPRVTAFAVVTTQASAGDGKGAYSSNGRCTILRNTGTSPLQTTTETDTAFNNGHDQIIKTAYVIEIQRLLNAWWVTDVWSCNALGSPSGPVFSPINGGGGTVGGVVAEAEPPPESLHAGAVITPRGRL